VLTLLVIGGSWFLILIINGNFNIIVDFIEYQIRIFGTVSAKHGGFFLYHFVVLFFGVFPASVFAINSFKRNSDDNPIQADFKKWMVYLFWVVLILFSVAKSKVVHYSSLCYFPLTFLCAHYLYHLLKNRTHIRKWNVIVLISISIVYGIAIIAVSYIDNYKTAIIESGVIKHAFAIGNFEADGQWTGFESLIGILLMAGIITGTRYLKRKPEVGITYIFATIIIFTYTAYIFLTPRIERYTQNAAIEFYKKLESKDTYVATLGYKSYAHLFYSKFKPQQHKEYLSKDWLGNGNIDKPAYFSTKIHKSEKYIQRYPKLEFLNKKNGFVFFKRESH
jgi:4-amino-4-deoxy-L-arabinose transferase-like glycosyltransferase